MCPEKLRTAAITQQEKEGKEKSGKKIEKSCGGHLVFQNEAKIYVLRYVFIGINIISKFGEYIFKSEWDRELL